MRSLVKRLVSVIIISVALCINVSSVMAMEYDESLVDAAIPFTVVSPVVEYPELIEPQQCEANMGFVGEQTVRLSETNVDAYASERAHIVDVAENGNITVDTYNDCARWVCNVLQAAGWNAPYWSGATYWEHFADMSHDMTNIPEGAIVIGTGYNSDTSGSGYYYGHIGICVGDKDGDGEPEIRDCIGPGIDDIQTQSLSTWLQWQLDCYCGTMFHEPGFVGWLYYPDLERAGADFTRL